ncbi:hypothetical protein TSOC_001612 [Tetrabaena socialis]|uniref:Uncharacterized protein n=1 Tax=Tetrabaena socialis TaxID=47790 RepID=A0A2J8AGC0_9CHLO|nr:hypothetical protein TSOC_001612 [Tetrabaena socialis]|eukprot:PNH11536.1 hypothetical protein TSOC_001612 [Tetrabaena socialis]
MANGKPSVRMPYSPPSPYSSSSSSKGSKSKSVGMSYGNPPPPAAPQNPSYSPSSYSPSSSKSKSGYGMGGCGAKSGSGGMGMGSRDMRSKLCVLRNKLREMAKKADWDAKTKEMTDNAVSKIERLAKKQFALDRQAAAAAAGSWSWDPQCSYYYNATYK